MKARKWQRWRRVIAPPQAVVQSSREALQSSARRVAVFRASQFRLLAEREDESSVVVFGKGSIKWMDHQGVDERGLRRAQSSRQPYDLILPESSLKGNSPGPGEYVWDTTHLGFSAVLDFVELLGLEPVLKLLQGVRPIPWTFLILAVVVISVASGFLIALTVYFTGLGYNLLARLTGGLVVELKEVRAPGPKRQA